MTLVERLRAVKVPVSSFGTNAGWTTHPVTHEAADRIEQLEAQLAERDKFIVSKGLWHEFVDQLPAALESKS